jgi:selenocysteine-specific elongation factor
LIELIDSWQIIVLETGEVLPSADLLAWDRTHWDEETGRARRELETYHRANPLRKGMSREELKSRLKIASPRLFNAAIRHWAGDGILEESGSLVRQPGFAVRFNPQEQEAVDRLLARFAQNPYSPPTVKDAQAEVGDDVFAALLDLGYFVPVSGEVVFRKEDYDRLRQVVHQHFEREETLTAAQFRDLLNTSRRYALAFLEHLDTAGVTVREGDLRRLRKGR